MLKKIYKTDLIQLLLLMKNRLWIYVTSVIIKNGIAAICFNIVIAFISKNIFDAAAKGDSTLLKKAIVLAGSAYILGSVLEPITTFIMNACIKKTMKEIRMSSFEKMESIEVEEIEKKHSGVFLSIITNDINSVEALYSSQINLLAFCVIYGGVAILSIFFLERKLAIIILILGGMTLAINHLFVPKIRNLNDRVQNALKEVTSKIIDLLDSITITKMYQAEDRIHRNFRIENDLHSATSIKLNKVEAAYDSMNIFFSNLKYISILCLSLFMMLKGKLSIGTVMAVMQLMGSANFMFENIGGFTKDVQKSLAAGKNVLEFLNRSIEAKFKEEIETIQEEGSGESVLIEDVSFSYPLARQKKNSPVIQHLNLSVKEKATVAVVGESGSGKSTLAKLLLGFYKANEGKIWIEGKPIGAYSRSLLRDQISYVPQNPYLFHGTIEENIGFGKQAAAKAEIKTAAKAAFIHDFILSLPMGYNTVIEEGGKNLSGGQRQRIAIARAFLKDAPILLLDEATSSLDTESETEIQKALLNLQKNRTVILIAHKVSTMKNADIIYVLKEGKIVEQGKHEDLIKRKGPYRKLISIPVV